MFQSWTSCGIFAIIVVLIVGVLMVWIIWQSTGVWIGP